MTTESDSDLKETVADNVTLRAHQVLMKNKGSSASKRNLLRKKQLIYSWIRSTLILMSNASIFNLRLERNATATSITARSVCATLRICSRVLVARIICVSSAQKT